MEEREFLTVYLPAGLITELIRRKGLSAHNRIIARREKIKQKIGTQPSSVDLIRQLRLSESRYDRA